MSVHVNVRRVKTYKDQDKKSYHEKSLRYIDASQSDHMHSGLCDCESHRVLKTPLDDKLLSGLHLTIKATFHNGDLLVFNSDSSSCKFIRVHGKSPVEIDYGYTEGLKELQNLIRTELEIVSPSQHTWTFRDPCFEHGSQSLTWKRGMVGINVDQEEFGKWDDVKDCLQRVPPLTAGLKKDTVWITTGGGSYLYGVEKPMVNIVIVDNPTDITMRLFDNFAVGMLPILSEMMKELTSLDKALMTIEEIEEKISTTLNSLQDLYITPLQISVLPSSPNPFQLFNSSDELALALTRFKRINNGGYIQGTTPPPFSTWLAREVERLQWLQAMIEKRKVGLSSLPKWFNVTVEGRYDRDKKEHYSVFQLIIDNELIIEESNWESLLQCLKDKSTSHDRMVSVCGSIGNPCYRLSIEQRNLLNLLV